MTMTLKDLMHRNRSYRRFYQDHVIDTNILKELVDLARLSPSGANLQPLKYIITADSKTNAQIFPLLGWASYLNDWLGPIEGERPSAYITIVNDTKIRPNPGCDHGIAALSIMLGAVERGLGGCIIATVKKTDFRQLFNLAEQYEILLVLALGKPKEKVILENIGVKGEIKYWRDSENVHHVPKRSLDEIIIHSS